MTGSIGPALPAAILVAGIVMLAAAARVRSLSPEAVRWLRVIGRGLALGGAVVLAFALFERMGG